MSLSSRPTRLEQSTSHWRRFRDWVHHRRVLRQYDLTGFGPFVVLRSGELADLAFPPRHGTRIWELSDGRNVDSSEISEVEDLSACGYQVRGRDHLQR